jgi:hypothetical protein
MRTKYLSGAAVTDLGNEAPFLPNYTVVVINTGTSADTLQFGDSSTGPFNTAAVVPAGCSVEVEIAGRYAAIENGAGTMVIVGN